MQAIRLTRARAAEWGIDPQKIGIMGFSAGAELAAATGVFFADFDGKHHAADDPLGGVSARPNFVALLYPGPTPFARGASPPVPRNAPPSFIASAGSGDRTSATWADEYFAAMLKLGVPNIEMLSTATACTPAGSRVATGFRSARGTTASSTGSATSAF